MSSFTIVMLTIGLVGLLSMIVSLIAGDLFDASIDTDTDTGGGGGWLSSTTIGLALAGFGFGSSFVESKGVVAWLALLIGIAIAVIAAIFAVFAIYRPLKRQEADITVRRDSYIGAKCKVTLTVPADGSFGEVQFVDSSGARTVEKAVSADNEPHPTGSEVYVVGVLGDAVEVLKLGN